MRAAMWSLVLCAFLLIPGPAGAQPALTRPAPPLRPMPVGRVHEIVIYRDRNFDGPAVSIPEDTPNLHLSWSVRSARVHSGVWQLCERPNYQGSCMTLSASSNDLGNRRVQSARATRSGRRWRVLGDVDINRLSWVRSAIDVRDNPGLSELRLCAERTRIRLHDAHARFTNNRSQSLDVPSQLDSGTCTDALWLREHRRGVLSSVEVSASAAMIVARGRVRLEGR